MQQFSLAIHGGAGTILKEDMTPDLEQAYIKGLEDALSAGYAVLEEGGSAVNAVKASIVALEDNLLFNAGRGSVFTKKGLQEMDAAIMDGKDLSAGSVAGIRNVRNPIELAAEVMLHSNHVFLSGKGANDFAIKQGIKLEPDEYFFSQFRYDQWKEIRDSDNYSLDHTHKGVEELMKDKKFGTVGAVACDQHGNIAGATSTGVAAHDVSCLMEYKGMSLQEAMHEVVHVKLIKLNGEGGMIGIDAKGNAAMLFNSAGMYRGMKSSAGEMKIGIYND